MTNTIEIPASDRGLEVCAKLCSELQLLGTRYEVRIVLDSHIVLTIKGA